MRSMQPKFRSALFGALVVLGCGLVVTPVSAMDCPHGPKASCGGVSSENGSDFGSNVCATCHISHSTGTGGSLIDPTKGANVNALCESCHYSGGPGTRVYTHASNPGSCTFCMYNLPAITCSDCHNPHMHEQPYDSPDDATPVGTRDMFLRAKIRKTNYGTTCQSACPDPINEHPDPASGTCVANESCPNGCVNQEQCDVFGGIATCKCPVNYTYSTGCSVCASAGGTNNNYSGASCRTTTCTAAGNPCAAGHGVCTNVADCASECPAGQYNSPANNGACTTSLTCSGSPCGTATGVQCFAVGETGLSQGERVCSCPPNINPSNCVNGNCNLGYGGANCDATCSAEGQPCANNRGTCQGGAVSTEFQVCSEDPTGQGGKCGPTVSCTNGGRSVANEVGLSCTGRSNLLITSVQDFTTDSPSGTNIKLWLRLLWTTSHTSSYSCTLTGVSAGGSFTISMSSVDCGLGDRTFCFVAAPVTITLNATSHRLTCSITPPAGNTFYAGFDGIIYTANSLYTPQQGGPACDSDATFSAGTCGLNWGPNTAYGAAGYTCQCSGPYSADCKSCAAGYIARNGNCVDDPCSPTNPCSGPIEGSGCYADNNGVARCNCTGKWYSNASNACDQCASTAPKCICNTGYSPSATATSTEACYNCTLGYHPENGACVPDGGGVCAGQTCSGHGTCAVDRNPSTYAALAVCACTGRYYGSTCGSCTYPPSVTEEVAYTMSAQTGTGSFADGSSANGLGICETCHTNTTHHRNAGTDTPVSHNAGANCITCHKHKTADATVEIGTNGFAPSETNPPVQSGTTCTNDTPCNGYTCDTGISQCRTTCSLPSAPCAAGNTCGGDNKCFKSCADCHLSATGGNFDVDNHVWDGTKAVIDRDEWTTAGHGRLNASGNYPSGNGPARFDEQDSTAGTHGCPYCHATTINKNDLGVPESVGHNTPGNYYRLANTTLVAGGNGTCLVCHGQGSDGYDPDGTGNRYVNINSNKKIDADTVPPDKPWHDGSKHRSSSPDGHNGGQFCWDCHDPHGDKSAAGNPLWYMIHRKPNEHSTPDGAADPAFNANNVEFRPEVAAPTNELSLADYKAVSVGLCRACHHDGTGSVAHGITKAGTDDGHPSSYSPPSSDRCTTACHKHAWGFKGVYTGGTCYTCHVSDAAVCSTGNDVLSYSNDGTRACISATEWTGPGHGRLTAGGNYPISTNPPANFDAQGGANDHGCDYCHNKNLGHPPGTTQTNYFILANQPASTGAFTYNGSSNTITRGSGSFVTDGFIADFYVTVSGTTSNNGSFKVGTVAATTLTLSTGALVNESPASSTLEQVNNKTCLICHDAACAPNCGGYDPDGAGTTYTNKTATKGVAAAHYGNKHGGSNHDGGRHCWNCHDPHGDKGALGRDQIYMIQNRPMERPDVNGHPPSTAELAVAMNFDEQVYTPTTSLTAGDYQELCAVCHDGTPTGGTMTHYYKQLSGQPTNDGHNIGATERCSTTCHKHDGNFAPPSNCISGGCHDSAQGSRRAILADFADGTGTRSHHAGSGSTYALRGTLKSEDCVVCHMEGWKDTADGNKIKTNDFFHGGTGGSTKIELRRAGSTANCSNGSCFTQCATTDPNSTSCNYWVYDKAAITGAKPGTWNQSNATWVTQMQNNVDPFCLSCHSSGGSAAATVVGETGATAQNPFNETGGIANNYETTPPQRTSITDIQSMVRATTDQDGDGRPDPPQGIYARHAITGQATSRYGTANASWSGTTYWTTAFWNETKTMSCADCHTNDGANDSTGNAHGADTEYLLKDGLGTAVAGTNYACYQCHASGYYSSSSSHSVNNANYVVGRTGRGNIYSYPCGNCHGGAAFDIKSPTVHRVGTIHGTSQVYQIYSATCNPCSTCVTGNEGYPACRPAYRFTNGNSLRFYNPGNATWNSNTSGCYTITGTTGWDLPWGGCTQHSSEGTYERVNSKGQTVRPLRALTY